MLAALRFFQTDAAVQAQLAEDRARTALRPLCQGSEVRVTELLHRAQTLAETSVLSLEEALDVIIYQEREAQVLAAWANLGHSLQEAMRPLGEWMNTVMTPYGDLRFVRARPPRRLARRAHRRALKRGR